MGRPCRSVDLARVHLDRMLWLKACEVRLRTVLSALVLSRVLFYFLCYARPRSRVSRGVRDCAGGEKFARKINSKGPKGFDCRLFES